MVRRTYVKRVPATGTVDDGYNCQDKAGNDCMFYNTPGECKPLLDKLNTDCVGYILKKDREEWVQRICNWHYDVKDGIFNTSCGQGVVSGSGKLHRDTKFCYFCSGRIVEE